MKPITQEWVGKAEGDANVVATVWQMADPVYDAICFHAQQCVEKYCKAWLVEQDIDFPKTHDYERLGWPPDQICDAHPEGSLAQIHAALSYYYAHKEEVDQAMREDAEFAERLRQAPR